MRGAPFELRHETKRKFERQYGNGRITASHYNLLTKLERGWDRGSTNPCQCFRGSIKDNKAAVLRCCGAAVQAQLAKPNKME